MTGVEWSFTDCEMTMVLIERHKVHGHDVRDDARDESWRPRMLEFKSTSVQYSRCRRVERISWEPGTAVFTMEGLWSGSADERWSTQSTASLKRMDRTVLMSQRYLRRSYHSRA